MVWEGIRELQPIPLTLKEKTSPFSQEGQDLGQGMRPQLLELAWLIVTQQV